MDADVAVFADRQPAPCHGGKAFPHWAEVLEKSYGLRCERHAGQTCEVGIEAREVGEIRVADVRMSGQTIAPRCRMEPAEDQLYLKLVVRGAAMFEQNGQRHCFGAGSLVLVDPARPFIECVEEETRLVVVTCPKGALRERGYQSHFNHWIAPDPRLPDVRMVGDMVRLIASYHDAVQERTRAHLGAQVLDLMEVFGNVEPVSSGRTTASVRYRIKRYIARHLGDERLDATAIANGVGLSVSYLNRLFREEGTSLMRFLWCQRLERAHRLLETSKRERLRIEEIAWRCGFVSAAHFSRQFRQRYGLSPKELRERGSCEV